VNEIGVRCLPYPRKGSSMSNIVALFDTEILALPNTIAKANKNFLVYCFIGILKMWQGHARCGHLDGLESIMAACDASILDEVPEDMRSSARIVKKMVVLI
jgi:hypothetical protein